MERGHANIVSELDPDAELRQKNKRLHPNDVVSIFLFCKRRL
jgi:hypothetical protein